MQLKLGVVCIIAALVVGMFMPIKYGGYIAVISLLIAATVFVITSPPLPDWEEDDDATVPAPGARSSRGFRRKK